MTGEQMITTSRMMFAAVFCVAHVAMASENGVHFDSTIRVWSASQDDAVNMSVMPEPAQDGQGFAPAPNLSSVKIIAVCSDNFYQAYYPYDCQDVRGLYSTGFDHGGTWMEVITEDIGYSSWRSATLNSSARTQIYTQYLVNSLNEVYGFRRWWDANGQQSGQFVYTAQSINAGPQLTSWIQIQ